jgi:hypothetical protein
VANTTIAARIVALLKERADGVDDDELAALLQLTARQQANIRCRTLEKEGVVSRQRVNGKIRNFLVGSEIAPVPLGITAPYASDADVKPWFWEGRVQAMIVQHLNAQQHHIRSVADTATRERGIDIIAERDGKELWVSVKGYPVGTLKTNPSLQASHWFKQVIFDVLAYRGLNKDVLIGVGLPDYPRYRRMAEKIDWFKPVGSFSYFWVRESGEVLVE